MTLLNESHFSFRKAPPGSSTAHTSFRPTSNAAAWSDAQHLDATSDDTPLNVPSTSANAMPVPTRQTDGVGIPSLDRQTLSYQTQSSFQVHQPQNRSALPHRTPPASGARYFGTSMSEGKSPTQRRYASSPLAGHTSARFTGRTPSQPLLASFLSSPDGPTPLRSSDMTRRMSSHYSRSPINSVGINRRRYSELSLSSGSLPLVGSLVGSYEESLLNGRMSTTPSKPLMFDAELGVLGLGKCRSALKCPPHLNVKFPAQFYNLDGAAHMEGKVSPSSPYVGTIDIEGHYMHALLDDDLGELPMEDEQAWHHKTSRAHALKPGTSASVDTSTRKKPVFPGYRVPAKGQVQLVIKNPNMTAVKVFLVPYDLSDMPAGKKTFVRQKCHITPPRSNQQDECNSNEAHQDVISPLSSPKSPNTRTSSQSVRRETLRYAVHLQFCAVAAPQHKPSKTMGSQAGFHGDARLRGSPKVDAIDKADGSKSEPRYYLHKAIRVVFVARVPDKSEKLTAVTETPQDANGDGIYSTFTGPSEDWKEARRAYKDRSVYGRASLQSSETAESTLVGDLLFTEDIANSDPNGERWAQRTPDERDVPMDVEPSEFDIADAINGIDVRSASSFASAERYASSTAREQARVNGNSTDGAEAETVPADTMRSYQDRALLQQWHASLNASRSTIARPSSPTTSRSRPTSPPLSRYPRSPNTHANIASSFAVMQRSLSNLSHDSDDGELSRALRSKGSKASIRPNTIRGLTNNSGSNSPSLLSNALHPAMTQVASLATATPTFGATISGFQSPKPSEASVDDEAVSGVMLPASVMQSAQEIESRTATANVRPSLLRRLSSQANMHADKVSPLQATHTYQPPANSHASSNTTRFGPWRIQSRSRASSEESQ